jgi:hypothetical protein
MTQMFMIYTDIISEYPLDPRYLRSIKILFNH